MITFLGHKYTNIAGKAVILKTHSVTVCKYPLLSTDLQRSILERGPAGFYTIQQKYSQISFTKIRESLKTNIIRVPNQSHEQQNIFGSIKH